jgi:hypothetical protein
MQYSIDASKFGKRNAKQATSKMSKLVDNQCKVIANTANTKGISLEQAADVVLKNNLDGLVQYVSAKGESPSDTSAGLIVQAALIRANDISNLSNSMGVSEADGVREIEAQESFARENDTADKDDVLPSKTQAALKVVIDGLQSRVESATGAQTLSGQLKLIKQNSATPLNDFSGNATYFGSVVRRHMGNFAKPDYIDFNTTGLQPLNVTALETTPANADDGGSFWDILDKIAATAGTVAGAIKTTAGAISSGTQQVSSTLSGTASNVGADSIQKYVARNWIYILLFIIVIAVIIILLSRAAKR